MRASERIGKSLRAYALIVALAGMVTAPMVAQAQVAAPPNETGPANATASEAPTDNAFVPPAAPDASGAKNDQAAARAALLQARRNLAAGRLEEALQQSEAAAAMGADWSQIGDSPRTIQNMITRQTELAGMAEARDPRYNAQAASFLLKQAHQLIAYGDLVTARTLIEQAQAFPVEFTPEVGNPEQLLALIEAAGKQPAAAAPDATPSAKMEVSRLMSQAQLAIDQGNWKEADTFVKEALAYELDDSAFAAEETRPWQMALRIQRSLNLQESTAEMNGEQGVAQSDFEFSTESKVGTAEYDDGNDASRNVLASGIEDSDSEPPKSMDTTDPAELYQLGLAAMKASDVMQARAYFEQAWNQQDQLDPATRQAIQDKLASLPVVRKETPGSGIAPTAGEAISQDDENAQALFRDLQSQVFRERAAAERMLSTDPRQALERMSTVREVVDSSSLDANSKRPLLTIIDRDIDDMQVYIEQNLSEIMNSEANASSRDEVERRRQRNLDVELQVQKLVDDFNRLMDEERYAEAQAVAQQAQDLAPNDEAVVALTERARFAARERMNSEKESTREQAYWDALDSADRASIPIDPDVPYQHGENTEDYIRRANMRNERRERGEFESEEERRIWNLLRNEKVQGEYRGTLSEAMEQLSRQAGVNIIFDRVALDAAQIPTDRPIDVPILNPITFRSALNTILDTVGLTFVVEDEVIKVTTPEAQRRDLKTKTYYVGDLVAPITNFDGGSVMNFMQPNQSYGGLPYGNQISNASPVRQAGGTVNQVAMAQQASFAQANPVAMGQNLGNAFAGNPGAAFAANEIFGGGYGGGPNMGVPNGQYNTIGPNSYGGITIGDFQPLIDLIKSTIAPDSWDDSNGDGTIQPYVSNLSLVVSQTQEVQDQIQDLLKKLRELNDVQIVIEVRFITLSDSFFERVGIDFDFRINDNSNLTGLTDRPPQSTVIGLDPSIVPNLPNPTGDLDIPFTQNSFGSSAPLFGGFDVNTAANFGFALLSDIEVFFLMQASKGDSRANVMQAPTLTMFNGQSANIFDGSTVPFVTSVTPVVGDFAVAHQPVITLLPEGTSLNVRAVVSNDRRFVRMTLVPYFSQIRDVDTFTFAGSTTTRSTSDSILGDFIDNLPGGGGGDPSEDPELETEVEGVTVQLPTLASTSISTVVSVPDGGTVLMGGIKRMSEGRVERGVPMLSNLPYINRLFKNVGIGRDTSNLMMMVTPRIIIQEEEEELQVGPIAGN